MPERDSLSVWVARAEEDFELARSSLRRRKPLVYGATFPAQQCVEKYLKAILLFREQNFPRTHDLIALNDLCLKAGIVLPISESKLSALMAYAVEVRYPGEQPTNIEARGALETAREVRKFARRILSSG